VSVLIRPAEARDIAQISRVLIASITALCVADHHNDPAKLAAWTRNKSVEGITAMLANRDLMMRVAERDGTVVGVGAVNRSGEVALNYVAPEARFAGISKALLVRLEADLVDRGFEQGRLEATETARRFYRNAGWVSDGPRATGRMVNGFPMRKPLSD
jgi:GNAT superfamily N-acetyltransferase